MADLRNVKLWRVLPFELIGTMVLVAIGCDIWLGQSSAQPVPAGTIALRRATANQLRVITENIWNADDNGFGVNNVTYDISACRVGKFFSKVKKSDLNEGTYPAMIALFNNYNRIIGIEEPCGPGSNCQTRETAFLDAILDTRSIQMARVWLAQRDPVFASNNTFKEKLREYWFERYSRLIGSNGKKDSSGFEHTFVGEIEQGTFEVKGFHNWVRMYREEQAGRLGQIRHYNSCPPSTEAITFYWVLYNSTSRTNIRYNKPRSSGSMRTSPEVEIALSTICLLTRPSREGSPAVDCPIRLKGFQQTMNTFVRQIRKGNTFVDTIASTYPVC